jgi:hypothetical protein
LGIIALLINIVIFILSLIKGERFIKLIKSLSAFSALLVMAMIVLRDYNSSQENNLTSIHTASLPLSTTNLLPSIPSMEALPSSPTDIINDVTPAPIPTYPPTLPPTHEPEYSNYTQPSDYSVNNQVDSSTKNYVKDYDYGGGKYTGDWSNGQPHGTGVLTWEDDSWMHGPNWKNGVYNGYGNIKYHDGSMYQGNIIDNIPNGKGKIIFKSGSVYDGDWVKGEFTGKGKLHIVFDDGNFYDYEGECFNSSPHGEGEMIWADGNKYTGEFRNGLYHGRGILDYYNDELEDQDGWWDMGNFTGP